MQVTSKSLNRMNSNRSMRSQESIKALEKGWSTKFKKAKALEENPTPALYRPVSRAGTFSAKKSPNNKSTFDKSID